MEIDRGAGKNAEESAATSNNSEESDDDINNKKKQLSSSWWGSWGQEWIDTVKEKSAETLNMVKKDLNEFVEVIQGDTAEKLSETASKLDEEKEVKEGKESTAAVVKQGISKLLYSVSELMTVEPDDSTEEIITLTDDKSILSSYDRKKSKLHSIQTDPGTYCNEPEGLFDEWVEQFDLDDSKSQMSDLLIQNTSIRAIYTQLVPNVISHTVFWQRYFYQSFLLDVEEKKRNDILARANNVSSKNDNEDEGWGEDEEDDDEIEVISKPIESSLLETNVVNDLSNLTIEEAMKISEKEKNKSPEVYDDKSVNVKEYRPETSSALDIITQQNLHNENANLNKLKDQLKNSVDDASVEAVTEDINKTNVTFTKEIDTTSSRKFTEGVVNKSLNESSGDDSLEKSCETLNSEKDWCNMNVDEINKKSVNKIEKLHDSSLVNNLKIENSETSSVSSWLSIDDDIKVKKIKNEQIIKQDSNGASEGKVSDSSSTVMVNKSDADDIDDFDLDLEDDVNEEELQKMVQEIKNKSATGNLQDAADDDDWENWE